MSTRTLLATLAVAALSISGCSYKGASIPNAGLPMASANYEIMGKTKASDCGTYVFGIDIPHLLSSNNAAVSASAAGSPVAALISAVTGGGGAEESRALYIALEKIPKATHLVDVRIENDVTGIAPFHTPFFAKRCATVHARGVKLGSGPVPNAN
jgi:hypothetical protein